MKTSLQSLFRKVDSLKSGAPLWTEEELRALIESSDTPSPFPHKPSTMRWKIMIPGILILAAGATTYFMQTSTALRNIDTPYQPRTVSQSKQPVAVVSDTTTLATYITKERPASEHPAIPTPSQIEGIHTLDLTTDELKTLGITATDSGCSLTAKLGVDYANPSSLMAFMSNQPNQRVEMKFRASGIKSVIEKLGGQQASDSYGELTLNVRMDVFTMQSKVISTETQKPQTLYPLVITHQSIDPAGTRKSQAQFFGSAQDADNVPAEFHKEIAGLFDLYSDAPTEKKQLSNFPLVSKLIPVRVTLDDKANSTAEIIYWYYPSPKFIAQLPERFQAQVKQEITTITKIETTENNVENTLNEPTLAPRETGRYIYTEVARAQSGAISISTIGPNPARERTTIFYSLTAERNVSVGLYDLSGRFIATLATADRISAGNQHEISVNVGQLTSGMYLLTMQTDRGEQAIQRLIIEN